MVFGGSDIWLENLENFCTKTCQFIRKKRDKNGPQLICIVLQYHIVQKVDLSEKIDGLVCLFGQILSNLAAFLIANCDFWLENTWLTFLKRFMTENWQKQKKKQKSFHQGSNWGPSVWQTDVITTTPRKLHMETTGS